MVRRALLCLLAIAACARPDPGLRATWPHPALPDDVRREDVALPGLYAQRWLGAGPPRGVLVIVHGLKDHSDRYSDLAATAARAGYAVYALDLPGHGRSPGPRVTIGRFGQYVDDAAALVEVARRDFPGLPAFVLGHSMGGVITARLAQTRGDALGTCRRLEEWRAHRDRLACARLAGVILSAPALGIDAPAFQAAAVVAAGGPGLGALPLFEPPTADFSSRHEVIDAMAADPLIHNAGAPVHTPAELLAAAGAAWDHAAALTVPIVILHGTADLLTAPAASRDFLRRVGTTDRTLRLYAGAWHDLAHEPLAATLAADVVAWMDDRHAGPATAPPLPEGRLRGERRGLVERHHLRGALITDPDTGGDLDATITFGVGRRLMVAATLEGRLALGGPAVSSAYGGLGLGTRLGDAGWIVVGAGGGRLGGAWRPLVQGELAFGPRGWPLALHARVAAVRPDEGDPTVESELTLRVPGNRTFWGRGRRGAGLTLGVRTVDASDGLAVVFGFDSGGFD